MIHPWPTARARLALSLAGCSVGVILAACGPKAPVGWSGYVEGDYVYVAAPVAGTLATLSVQAGQTVAAGAPLFHLDDVAARAARAQGDAQLQAATAQAADTTKGRRADEIAMTRAQLAQARLQAERADVELQRQQALVAQGFISRSHLDDAATALTQARAHVAELEAALRVAELPARADAQTAARASASAASQALVQLQWREDQATQAAPTAALVADTFFRVGEYVPAGQPVLALLPPAGRKARFYVPESERGGVAPGQAVSIRCDGCGAPIAARISRVATQAEYTPPVIYSNSQRARLVFRVEAVPDAADALRLQPGQPVDVLRDPGAVAGS
jgi:HlyD family secretion protein